MPEDEAALSIRVFGEFDKILATARELAPDSAVHKQRLTTLALTDYYRNLVRRFGESVSQTEILKDDVLYRRVRFFAALFPRLEKWYALSKDLYDERNHVAHSDNNAPDAKILAEGFSQATAFRDALAHELAVRSQGTDLSTEIAGMLTRYSTRTKEFEDLWGNSPFNWTSDLSWHRAAHRSFERIVAVIPHSETDALQGLQTLIASDMAKLENEFDTADSEARAMVAESRYEAWKDSQAADDPGPDYDYDPE